MPIWNYETQPEGDWFRCTATREEGGYQASATGATAADAKTNVEAEIAKLKPRIAAIDSGTIDDSNL